MRCSLFHCHGLLKNRLLIILRSMMLTWCRYSFQLSETCLKTTVSGNLLLLQLYETRTHSIRS